MNYIYDILLNFEECDVVMEPFEWESSDELVNVKKTLVLRVTKKVIEDFLGYKIKINKNLLNKFSSYLYKENKRKYKYITVISDGYTALGLLFNDDGLVIRKSKMLYDEEGEAREIALGESIFNFEYNKYGKEVNELYLTREDIARKNFLIKELKNLYKNKEEDELKYLYMEYFSSKCDDINIIYKELLNSLDCINQKHVDLCNLLKMCYKR